MLQGEVYAVGRDGSRSVFATGLGIATGIAFDAKGLMYVGDRSGTVYRVKDIGETETFAVLEPSVAAYHLAFGPDERLYVTAPGLASHDAVFAIDKKGDVTTYFRGFGRPQGLAFDKGGNLVCRRLLQGPTRHCEDRARRRDVRTFHHRQQRRRHVLYANGRNDRRYRRCSVFTAVRDRGDVV